jgi:hypothetical protein
MIRAAFSNRLQPGKRRSQHTTMLFKTISASVYGIDAYPLGGAPTYLLLELIFMVRL